MEKKSKLLLKIVLAIIILLMIIFCAIPISQIVKGIIKKEKYSTYYFYRNTSEYDAIPDIEGSYEKVLFVDMSEFDGTNPTIINSEQEFLERKMQYKDFKIINKNIWNEKSVIVARYSNNNKVVDIKVTDIRVNENTINIDIATSEADDAKSKNNMTYIIVCDKIPNDANIKINVTRYKAEGHKVKLYPVSPTAGG